MDFMTIGSIPYPASPLKASSLSINLILLYFTVDMSTSIISNYCMYPKIGNKSLCSLLVDLLIFHLTHNFYCKVLFTFFHTYADFIANCFFYSCIILFDNLFYCFILIFNEFFLKQAIFFVISAVLSFYNFFFNLFILF